MIELNETDAERFEKLKAHATAARETLTVALAHFQSEQEKLIAESQQLWREIKATYGLRGEWEFREGKLFPTSPPPANDQHLMMDDSERFPLVKDGMPNLPATD